MKTRLYISVAASQPPLRYSQPLHLHYRCTHATKLYTRPRLLSVQDPTRVPHQGHPAGREVRNRYTIRLSWLRQRVAPQLQSTVDVMRGQHVLPTLLCRASAHILNVTPDVLGPMGGRLLSHSLIWPFGSSFSSSENSCSTFSDTTQRFHVLPSSSLTIINMSTITQDLP